MEQRVVECYRKHIIMLWIRAFQNIIRRMQMDKPGHIFESALKVYSV